MVRLKWNMEKMMSTCLTWFPNWLVLGEPNIYQNLVCFTMKRGFYLRVSDCEEIEGVTHKREWGREIIESK